jgi:AcrR family transcriptional regulator
MTETVSTSKMRPEARPYHHPDLRTALLDLGMQLIEARSIDQVGVRELARLLGVSPNSVYRHFPDKAALLKALADRGLAKLGAAHREALEAVGGGELGFIATGRAYVRFAQEKPGLFRLMFANSPRSDPGRWHLEDDDAMELLRENAMALVAPIHGEQAALLFALRSWALVHGLAMLILDKQVVLDDAAIDAVIGSHDFSFLGGK